MLTTSDEHIQKIKNLGYTLTVIRGVEVIIPPVCDIPGGAFQMGTETKDDPEAFHTESPVCEVETSAYSLAKFPVTVGEFACYVRSGGTRPETRQHLTWEKQLEHPDHPVVCVRWIDAVDYISWLKRLTGMPWRLPTEAEWEKAARWTPEGEYRIYPWGNTFDSRYCNTNASKIGTTTPVDRYPEGVSVHNVWDMAGNVWEWTSSIFYFYPYIADRRRENPLSMKHRVLRGGSWLLNPSVARSTCRNKENPVSFAGYFYDVGFRLLLEKEK